MIQKAKNSGIMAKTMKLVVQVPAYNESKSIANVVKSIPRTVKGIGKVKVVVVDDGSRDNTAKIAQGAGADRVVSHTINRGLGVAFRTGIENALRMGADVVVNIDADGQFNSNDIPALIKPVLEGKADLVTCTRFSEEMPAEMPFMKRIGNRFFTWLTSLLTGQRFTDTQCGFRAYSQEACLRMNLFGRFTYTQEVLLDLIYKGLRVIELPFEVKPQREGKSRVVKHWWSYGMKAMMIIVRAIRDHHPLKFFGGIGIVSLLLAVVSAIVMRTGIVTQGLMVMGLLLIVLALLADMNFRQRKLIEEQLYLEKKRDWVK